MHLADLHVIIVGGATGGGSAALLLARAGARVTLVERVAQPRAVGAGIAIAENGMAVLESLGMAPALDVAREVRGMRVTDAVGRTLLTPPHPTPRVRMVRRATLQGVLLDAVAAEPRIERLFGTEALSAAPDGTVDIRDAEGARMVCTPACASAARSVRACGTQGSATCAGSHSTASKRAWRHGRLRACSAP